jgi:signal transduction histidine kinase
VTSAPTPVANTIGPAADPPSLETLVEMLTAHRALQGVPRSELEWLAMHGEFRRYQPRELLAQRGTEPVYLAIMLRGAGAMYVERGGVRRKMTEWGAGELTGLLPFSRMTVTIGDPVLEQPSDVLFVHRDQFPEMIRLCPNVTAACVHTMLDRARHFLSTDWQDEKTMALGRLAAGLAHELNNPASAAARSAALLDDALTQLAESSKVLEAAALNDEQRFRIDALRGPRATPAEPLSPLARADREEEVAQWLGSHGVDAAIAPSLADAGVTISAIISLAAVLPRDLLAAALRSIAAWHAARALAADVRRAAARVDELVSAIKRFTWMDRPMLSEPAHLGQSLSDAVTVLGAKAREKRVSVALDVAPDLPLVAVYGGELSQVWANLIENALDAVHEGGHVRIAAHSGQLNTVVVSVTDDGPGIPEDIRPRIFDPFFTTKPMGDNTGMGLDIARRIVRRHNGTIELQSRPAHTEFRVTLPAIDQARRPGV